MAPPTDIPTTTAGGFGTGNWFPQPADYNDWKYQLPSGYKQDPNDKIVTLEGSGIQTDVFDQGGLGSCTANAIVEALRYAYARESANLSAHPSRLFLYYLERIARGAGDMITPSQLQDFLNHKPVVVKDKDGKDKDVTALIQNEIQADNGANLRNGMKALNKFGICTEETWPYPMPIKDTSGHYPWTDSTGDSTECDLYHWWGFFIKDKAYYNPDNLQDALKQAPNFISKTFTYWRIHDYNDGATGLDKEGKLLWPGPNNEAWTMVEYIKAALTERLPVVFAFWAPDDKSFEKIAGPKWVYDSKITPDVLAKFGANDNKVFGHAVCIVGFNDTQSQFTVLNSWGPNWGDKGYFYMPYTWFHAEDSWYTTDNGKTTWPRVADIWVVRMKTS